MHNLFVITWNKNKNRGYQVSHPISFYGFSNKLKFDKFSTQIQIRVWDQSGAQGWAVDLQQPSLIIDSMENRDDGGQCEVWFNFSVDTNMGHPFSFGVAQSCWGSGE